MNWRRIAAFGLSSLALSLGATAQANLVTNGGFELAANGTPNNIGQLGGQVNVSGTSTSLQAWTLGTTPAAVDVADQNYDSSGVPTQFGYGKVWGPGNGVSNGFTGSPDGGHFLAADADFETSSIFQTINGLTAGHQYTLSFDWAGAQATGYFGSMTEWWKVSFGGSTVNTPQYVNPSQGFSGWTHFSTTFTATSVSQLLSFLPSYSGPSGLPPVLLLDGVSLTPVSATPEPSSAIMAVMGVGIVGGVSWNRRRKAKLVS